VSRALAAVLAAAALLAGSAGANLPPAPLSEAMAAVTGDYVLRDFNGGEGAQCPVTLATTWAAPGEILAEIVAKDRCIAKAFASIGLKGPLTWTLFAGGGIVVRGGAVELQLRPNYMPGNYIANAKLRDGSDTHEITLERVRP
jgi:hypothetical protein